ncbi:hypothetical protein VPH35_113294 [Triticum aestivum]
MFPMFQELAPHDPHDKCGHHYAICLDLKNQRFEVLDSMRSAADAGLTSHAEFFINNVKETWNHHYENSKVQIRHFSTEYVATRIKETRRTMAFTRWNTLQSGKVDLSLLSQLQRSLSSRKFTHGTG